ncbi:MAG TPA: hypothetical protein VKT73_13270 [Xanthobacteraceae bacterium]|nr:hypothetical protein [Xanthobacteraceae bacterium]
MDRWHILKTRFGGVYVHLFHHDDDDRAIHDHPWSSISLLLQGTQREIYAAPGSDPKDALQHSFRTLREGAITVRPASFAHRIELTSFKAMTLFIVGPKTREWGFWCPKGFRHWIEYCKPDAMGEIGRGCE